MRNKKIVFLLFVFVLLALVAGVLIAGAQKTIAVLYFENNSLAKRDEMEPLRKGLADMFITEFSKINQFKVVERSRLEQLIQEMQLGQSGMLDSKTAQQVGKLLGAQNLVFGSYMNLSNGKMRIDIRIVEVETGLTIKAEEATGKAKDLYKLVSKLVVKIIKNLDVRVSKADVMRLARVENKSFDAALYYAKGLEYEDAGDVANAKKMYSKALKKNKNFNKAKQRLQALSR